MCRRRSPKTRKPLPRRKAEDDYLLTTKLFCGYCGALMFGESGVSHTGKMYTYYKCAAAKKKKTCDKRPCGNSGWKIGSQRDHAEYAALETIQKCSDILSLHLAVTPQTVNMVDAGFLAGMKDGAFSSSTLPAATLWPAPPLPKPCAAARSPEPDWTPLRRNRSQRKIRCSACRMIAAAIMAVQSGQRPENIVNGL